jgi:hypothetical protein
MGDVNNRDAFCLERANHSEQMRDFAFGNRRRWFIHNNQTGVVGDRLGNFDHLGIGHAQVFHHTFGINFNLKPLEKCFGVRIQLAFINQTESTQRFAPKEDIFRDGHIGNRRELLVNHRDTQLERPMSIIYRDGLPLEGDLTAVWRIDAIKDLH